MKGLTFALIDVNSAYCSYFGLSEPHLRDTPCVVLSAQDGIVIAANQLARDLGIVKFQPWFKIRQSLTPAQRSQVAVRSSTFEHINEVSSRFHHILESQVPEIFRYSVDECFGLYGRRSTDWHGEGLSLKKRIWQELRCPVGVGFGSTMALCKIANHAAKRLPEFAETLVAVVREDDHAILERVDISSVWGIGRRLASKLEASGISNALQLARAPRRQLRRDYGVTIERLHLELNGIACLGPGIADHSQQIASMRSLSQSQRFTGEQPLATALADRLATAYDKLIQQNVTVSQLSVYAATPAFDRRVAPYSRSVTVPLGYHTRDLRDLANAVREGASRVHRPGVLYGRVGVTLLDPRPLANHQEDLFAPAPRPDAEALTDVIEQIHKRFGRDTLTMARCSLGAGQERYGSRHTLRSLTRWGELAMAR